MEYYGTKYTLTDGTLNLFLQKKQIEIFKFGFLGGYIHCLVRLHAASTVTSHSLE